jgi:hypothetical protein
VLLEEFKRALTRFKCRGGVIARADIAIEGVAGVVPEYLDFRMRGVESFHVGGGNVRVLAAEMEHDGAAGFFGGVIADAAAVVADCRGGMEAHGGEPGDGAAKAIADDADFFVCRARGEFQCSSDIKERLLRIEFGYETHRGLHIGSFVAEFDAGADTVEDGGRDDKEAIPRPAIGHGTNVSIHAEDFLDDDQAGDRLARRPGDVGAELVAVGCAERNRFAHGLTSSGDSSIHRGVEGDQAHRARRMCPKGRLS